jgi:murein DD-endopeptidase MepM/ murein hydrolase activator NlpD
VASSSIFPAFITDEYRPGRGFADFETKAQDAARTTERTFKASMAEIEIAVSRAMSRPTNAGGFDLGVTEFRQAAEQARAYAQTLKVVEQAARNLATSTNDTTGKTRSYLSALAAQIKEAESVASANDAVVTSYSRLQAELNQTVGAANAASAAMRALYGEQIAAAAAEVSGRRFEQFAGVGRSARANGATTGLLEQKAEYDALATAERNAAVAADLLAVIHDRVGISVSQAGRSASESARTFELAAQAEERLALQAERAWAELNAISPAARRAEIALLDAGKASESAFSIGNHAAEQFGRHLIDVQNMARNALATPRNETGSLDLNIIQYRQAAAAAEGQAVSLREVANAAQRAATAHGDTTEATRLYVQASRAAAIEAENEARAMSEQVIAMERVQAELNQTASRTSLVVTANRGLAGSQDEVSYSARASRFAMVQVGQQVQDMAIQLQSGTDVATIFVQQVSQMGFALSQMEGKLGAVGRFLAGGWGTALFLGITAIGLLTNAMSANAEAEEEVKTSAQNLSSAQSVLGEIFDLTTGKIRDNSEALRLNALVAAANMRVQAELQRSQGMQAIESGMMVSEVAGSLSSLTGRRGNPDQNAVARVLTELQRNGDRQAAVRRLIALAEGQTNELQAMYMRYAAAISSVSNAERSADIATRMLASLESGTPDPMFMRNRDRNRRGREDRRPQQAEQSIEQITRINEQWDDQPRIVDRAVQAVRELDRILAEASRRKLPRFAEMQAGAAQAQQSIREGLIREITQGFSEAPKLVQRATAAIDQLNAAAEQFPDLRPQIAGAGEMIVNSLLRPYREFLADQVRSYDAQQLIAQGRDEEAEALIVIHRLEEQLGPLGEDRRRVILESVLALRQQARELEIIRERQQMYLTAANSVRGAITDAIADPRQMLSSISSIGQAYNRLRAEFTVDRLFGGLFRQIEDRITGRDRVLQANEDMAVSISSARAEVQSLTTTQRSQRDSIEGVISATQRFTAALNTAADAANANGVSAAVPPAAGREDGGAFDLRAGAAAATAAASSIANAVETALRPFTTVSSGFGHRRAPIAGARTNHPGYDFPAPYGTDIPAPLSGRVTYAGPRGGQGNVVVVDHGNGLTSLSAHMSSIAVSLGQLVHRGDTLGGVGSTGISTGNHLHQEFRRNGAAVDPATIYGRAIEVMGEAQTATTELSAALPDATANLEALHEAIFNLGRSAPAAADGVLELISSAFNINQAANDNNNIAVTGARRDATASLNPRQFMQQLFSGLASKAFGDKLGSFIGSGISTAMEGAAIGSMMNGVMRTLGVKSSNTGAQIGGALGNFIPGLPPGVGAAIGSIVGGIAGGLIKSTPRASSSIGVGADGRLAVTGTTGTRSLQGQTTTAAESVLSTVERIAEALGGSVNAARGSVSIGVRDGNYRVDTTGRGITKTKKGAIDFGEDAEAAVRAAVLDLIKDGVIEGLRQGTQTLLRAAKDIDSGIEKALKFESVFTRLKEHVDPVGAALDTLDKEFANLKRIFEEAGASAEEYAQLEQLYALEREQAILQSSERLTSALKGLLDDLTVNNDALSLRDRLAQARAKYDPLAARLAAGDKTVDYDAFAEAARLVESLTRQVSGSTSPYFAVLDEITRLTQSALAAQQNVISIATANAGPFAGGTSGQTSEPVVTAIDRLGTHLGGIISESIGGQLSAVNDNLGTIARQLSGMASAGGGGSFPPFDNPQNF